MSRGHDVMRAVRNRGWLTTKEIADSCSEPSAGRALGLAALTVAAALGAVAARVAHLGTRDRDEPRPLVLTPSGAHADGESVLRALRSTLTAARIGLLPDADAYMITDEAIELTGRDALRKVGNDNGVRMLDQRGFPV